MTSPPTIKDIARIARVSQSTVSKALNDRSDVSDDTRTRIIQIAKEHNYHPSAHGRALKKRTSDNIGVIFYRELQPLSGNPFYSRVLEGIEAELAINHLNLVLHFIFGEQLDSVPRMIRERQVDGAILVGIIRRVFVQTLLSRGVPLVLVDPKTSVSHCTQVVIDNEHGAFLATDYLARQGHRRIGFISGDRDRLSFQQRFEGYLKALKHNGLEPDETLVSSGGLEHGYEHMRALLTLPERPTAVFAANDINAILGYQAIRDLGLNVPGDISVIGFDDIDLARVTGPALTTIRVYKEELGSIAVRRLVQQIKEKRTDPSTTVVPVRLIERDSVSPIGRKN